MPPVPPFAPLTTPVQLGNALRAARERLGLSYAKAATKCRVSYRFYWELENGKPGARLDKVLAVAKGLGLALGVALPPPGAR